MAIDEDRIEDPDVAPMPSTEGRLTILRPQHGGELVEIGHVDGLGEG